MTTKAEELAALVKARKVEPQPSQVGTDTSTLPFEFKVPELSIVPTTTKTATTPATSLQPESPAIPAEKSQERLNVESQLQGMDHPATVPRGKIDILNNLLRGASYGAMDPAKVMALQQSQQQIDQTGQMEKRRALVEQLQQMRAGEQQNTQNALARAQNERATAQESRAAALAGPQLAQENLQTEAMKRAAEAPITNPIPEGGQLLIRYKDGTERLIENPKEPTNPATAIQEYQYYVTQEKLGGRTPLSFDEYQTREANRRKPVTNINLDRLRNLNYENLTNAAEGQLVYAATGNAVPTQAIGDAASDRISKYNTALQQTDVVAEALAKLGATGAIKGYTLREGIYWPVVQDKITEDQAAAVSETQRLINSYLYAVSGKQINEQELVRIARTAPDIRFTPETNKTILEHFKRFVKTERDNYLKVRGWKFKEGGTQNEPPFPAAPSAPNAPAPVEQWERGPDGKLRRKGG